MRILAVYVGTSPVSRLNLQHGLEHGIWGFKENSRPVDFDTLEVGDFILLATGHSGGGPRTPTEEWMQGSLTSISFARITKPPFKEARPEWPDEANLAEGERYYWRVGFDAAGIKTINNVSLKNGDKLSSELAESFRKSGAANGRGYVLPASHFRLSASGPTESANADEIMRLLKARLSEGADWSRRILDYVAKYRNLDAARVDAMQNDQLWKLWTASGFAETGTPNFPNPTPNQWEGLRQATKFLCDRSRSLGDRFAAAEDRCEQTFSADQLQQPLILRTLLILEGGSYGTIGTKSYTNELLEWAERPALNYRDPASITNALNHVRDIQDYWAGKVDANNIGDRARIPWELCGIIRDRKTRRSLCGQIESVLEEFLTARNSQPFSGSNPVCQHFAAIQSAVSKCDFVQQRINIRVKWGAGQGNWARVPWIALLDQRETTTTMRGVYCVYLFRQDMSGVYLTFNQGVTEPCNQLGRAEGLKALKSRAHKIRQQIPELSQHGFSLDDDIDLKADPGLGADYETSTIAHKFYPSGAVPNDAGLLADLEAVLQAYDRYLANPIPLVESPNEQKYLQTLGVPFNEIFASFTEGQWGFDLLQAALLLLRVDPLKAGADRRISLTLVQRSGEGVRLRLNFGNWAIVTFLNQSVSEQRIQYICREDLLPTSAPPIKQGQRFTDAIEGRSFVLTTCSAERMRDLESPERRAFDATLPLVAHRFKDWVSSPYHASHQPKALEMVFDSELRDELLRTGLQFTEEDSPASLQSMLQRYHDEQVVFVSSAERVRYAIVTCDANGADVGRLDGNKPERVTFARAEKLIQSVQTEGSVDFVALDNTAAIRNAVLQAELLALTADQGRIVFLQDNRSRASNFCAALVAMNRSQPLYKPVMLLCVLDGIESGELALNQITFDWIAPRFIALMEVLGQPVTEQQAAQPFFHLTSDLFWLHAVSDLKDLMEAGDGPGAARKKVKYALLKDTYWNLLQDPISRALVRLQLEKLIMPTPDQLLSAVERAIIQTGFQCPGGLVGRFLGALAAKPFVILTGNSGTGKTKLAVLVSQWLSGKTSADDHRYAVVPVGADWTDNRNVVGFVNHLRKDDQGNPIYQATPVLELLLRAKDDREHPYFLILDEMNLSHVERYFADFLSAMESKKPIPLHHEEQPILTPSGSKVPSALAFPENLFVIGTVNVDETTYMFSPKVLDRANVLEFRIGLEQAKAFLAQERKHVADTSPAIAAPLAFLELARRSRGLAEPALDSPGDPALEEYRKSLQGLFDLLHNARLEFAFRTISEITRYLQVDFAFATDKTKWAVENCLDAQVLQKILPKLHGSRRRLEAILIALATYCEKRDFDAAKKFLQREAELSSYPPATPPSEIAFPMSHTKLIEMIEAVRRDQFVSFIQ